MRQTIQFTGNLVRDLKKSPLEMMESWQTGKFDDGKSFHVVARIYHENDDLYEFIALPYLNFLEYKELIDLYNKGWEVLLDGEWRSITIDEPEYLIERNFFGRRSYPISVFI